MRLALRHGHPAATTRGSARHAVIVLRDEDKPEAKALFRTPLVFSVHEAKGLEYPHVVLMGLVSGQRAAYAELCDGVTAQDLERGELEYRRARDKGDKSLELYKFYVNALYVAMTRAVQSLTLVETDTGHPIFDLLGLRAGEARTGMAQNSTKEEWAQEARKLEALKLDWLDRGTGTDGKFRVRPAAAVARAHERATDSELAQPAAG